MSKLDLILLAAGKGTRTTLPVAKQFLKLAGIPVMIHALKPFERLACIDRKIVAAAEESIPEVESLLEHYEITNYQVVCGGPTRQASVRLALQHVRTDRVITHNAALPFVTEKMIESVAKSIDPCVTTATPMNYPLCRGDSFATELVRMDDLKLINTPQSFDAGIFRECHRRALAEQVVVQTDCELMLRYGHAVRFVGGDPCNFKITTEMDVVTAEALMKLRNEASVRADQMGQR